MSRALVVALAVAWLLAAMLLAWRVDTSSELTLAPADAPLVPADPATRPPVPAEAAAAVAAPSTPPPAEVARAAEARSPAPAARGGPPRERCVGGIVRGLQGQPIAGVAVHAWYSYDGGSTGTFDCLSDQDGRFGFAFPEPGAALPSRILFRIPTGGRHRPEGPSEVEATMGMTDVDLVVSEVPAVRVRVVDAATGLAVAHARLEGVTTVEDGGEWLVYPPPEGAVAQVSADGFAPRTVRLAPGSGGATRTDTIALTRGVSLAGRLLASGADMGCAGVVLLERCDGTDDAGDRVADATTDGEGRWSHTLLAPGRYRILGFAPGHGVGRVEVEVATDNLALELRLPARGAPGEAVETLGVWAERRDLVAPFSVDDVSGDELLEWIEAWARVRITRDAEVERRLAGRQLAVDFRGMPVREAIGHLTLQAGLTWDPDAGVLRAAAEQD